MTQVTLQIDGKPVEAAEGTSILDAARSAGISIPTMCHHDELMPFGACRLCIVEVERGDAKQLVVSCAVAVEAGSLVRTRSEKVDRLRKSLLELMLAHAPHAPQLQTLAREYGASRDRFEKEADFCIHCGLCVRYCAEVKQANAIGFIDRGVRKEICFIPEIASKECHGCMECFPLCPTSFLQATFVLGESLAFSSAEGG